MLIILNMNILIMIMLKNNFLWPKKMKFFSSSEGEKVWKKFFIWILDSHLENKFNTEDFWFSPKSQNLSSWSNASVMRKSQLSVSFDSYKTFI